MNVKETMLKFAALDKIVSNAQDNKKDAFNSWKNWCEISKIQGALTDQKKKMMIETLSKCLGSSKISKLRVVLAKFNENAKIKLI